MILTRNAAGRVALRPVAGAYPLPSAPGLNLRIVKSYIRDQAGAVISEIG